MTTTKTAEELQAELTYARRVIRQCRDALAKVEGKARTGEIINAYCRAVHALQP